MDDIRVSLRNMGCGYLVVIESNDCTRTWSFADINDVKLWADVLEKVIVEYERIQRVGTKKELAQLSA